MASSGSGRLRAGWVLLIGGAALAMGGAVLRRTAAVQPAELEARAEDLQKRVTGAISVAARTLETDATAAARVPELISGLDIEADAHTFQDLFESEEWWASYRGHFPLSSLVSNKGTLALLGAGVKDLASDPLVQRAREAETASGVVAGRGRGFLAAAAKVTRNKHPESGAVVVVGVPFDDKTLAVAADGVPFAAGLGLSDGTSLLAFADKGEGRASVTSLVGQESFGAHLVDEQRAGHAWALGPGLWIVAAFAPPEAAPSPAAWPLVFGGLGLSVLGLLLVLTAPRAEVLPVTDRRRAAPAETPALDQVGATRLGAGAPPPAERIPRTPGWTDEAPLRERDRAPAPSDERDDDRRGLPRSGGDRVATLPDTPAGRGGTMAMPHGGALAALAMTPTPSFQMGRYTLVERIGEGGMAEIFFARSHGAEGFVRELVVKRMHPHLARNRLAVSQFIDEARVQSELVHPNIVPVLDFGKAGDEYFLALDIVHGRDLGAMIARHVEVTGESLPLPIAFYVMHEVLEALEFAHTKIGKDGRPLDVVHRDVAPGNILVSFLGEVKLSDFGIAKSEHRVSHTEIGMVKGNASFMSPEQARGENVDRRSDLFSAGVVLFYLLTAKLLYRGETTLNQLLRAAVGPHTSQFTSVDTLPAPAHEVLHKALATDAAERFQSAKEFAAALAPHMAGRKELFQLMSTLFPPGER